MTNEHTARLEELRAVLRAENMSYGELTELQGLAPFIDLNDPELCEAAGIPEFPETFTVFAVYAEDFQPYATSVEVRRPEDAPAAAQAAADEANGSHVELVGFQVVRGGVETVL